MKQAKSRGTRTIPITKPFLGPEEAAAVREVLESGWLVQGPRVLDFEAQFATFAGATHAVAATSCTTALHLAVAALGLKPGDEVIVPAFTWISTANVVEYMGAQPIFVDIDPRTFNADVDAVAAAVSERTVGIIAVHLFGLCANMKRVGEIAAERGLWVLEDGACALGARIGAQHAGTFGVAGAFSFHPRKAITTGEGGMLTTDNETIASAARSLRDHGASRSDFDRHASTAGMLLPEYERLGFNYRMTDVQAAIGIVQLSRVGKILESRHRQAARYDDALSGMNWLTSPHVPEGYTHGYQSYVTWYGSDAWNEYEVDAVSHRRNLYMARLQDQGIATRQGTHAAALQSYYRSKYQLEPGQFPMAYAADRLTLSLPLFATMTNDEQDYVIALLEDLATME